ncbi:LOB domain-containing protein 6 [Dendrobium catenatum]|uniref:LOB domain-containing protein 6 n=2 Tax=Dendrobium catenatum TaxID=906689 RepID=A0A2I0WXE1_9ASPA|nr:LOB domain-containing protein 6 [Dendrobium catenatum]
MTLASMDDQQSPILSTPSSVLSSSSSSMAAEWGSVQNTPCAACKYLRRKCHPDCIFAPYFLPEQQQMFALVHRVFGASNVAKILTDLHPRERQDAVISLVYESKMYFIDPVYGCVRTISGLQQQLEQIQFELSYAFSELSRWESAMAALEERKLKMEEQQNVMMINNGCDGSALEGVVKSQVYDFSMVVDKETSTREKDVGAFQSQYDFAEDDELRSLLEW